MAANWSGFTASDYLTNESVTFNNIETKFRIRFIANLSAARQNLAGQGSVQPYTMRFEANKACRLSYRNASNGVAHLDYYTANDGELVDFEIKMKPTADEFVVTNMLTEGETTYSRDIHDSYAASPTLLVGSYPSGQPATEAKIELFEISYEGVPTHSWDFSAHPTEDQVGSNDLTIIGAPVFSIGLDAGTLRGTSFSELFNFSDFTF